MGAVISQFEIIAETSSLPDLFHRLEAADLLLRMDPRVEPTCYRCAVVSREELRALRLIPDIVRLGRVRTVERSRLVLDQAKSSPIRDTLYVDCSACAIQMPPAVRVFEDDTINLLMLRTCQPLFSAALIWWVEAHVADPAEKNALCDPVPSPEHRGLAKDVGGDATQYAAVASAARSRRLAARLPSKFNECFSSRGKFARLSSQASLGMIQRVRPGGTPFCSSHRQASMPVLPDPITVYREWGRRIFGNPFTGMRSTPSATSYLGGCVEGISVLA